MEFKYKTYYGYFFPYSTGSNHKWLTTFITNASNLTPLGRSSYYRSTSLLAAFFFFSFSSPFPPNQGRWESIENQGNGWKISWSWNVLDWTFTSKGTSKNGGERDRHPRRMNFEAWALWMWGGKLRWKVGGGCWHAQMEDKRSKTQEMNGTNKCSAVNTTWHLYRKAKPFSVAIFINFLDCRRGLWGFSAYCSDTS